jgi:hypothetical protein
MKVLAVGYMHRIRQLCKLELKVSSRIKGKEIIQQETWLVNTLLAFLTAPCTGVPYNYFSFNENIYHGITEVQKCFLHVGEFSSQLSLMVPQ